MIYGLVFSCFFASTGRGVKMFWDWGGEGVKNPKAVEVKIF